MDASPRLWGLILPLRWYIQILFDQAARGVPAANSVAPFADPRRARPSSTSALAWLRLRAVARRPAAPRRTRAARPPSRAERRRRSVRGRIAPGARRPRRLRPDRARAAPLWRALPAALSRPASSATSRSPSSITITRSSAATSSRPLMPTRRQGGGAADTLAEAQAALARREVSPSSSIPAGHRARGAEGRSGAARRPMSIRPISCSTTARCRASRRPRRRSPPSSLSRGARPDGSLYRAALARSSPGRVPVQPLFNPTGGYASYVVPAAFVLILQQTLLMGSATLGGAPSQQGGLRAAAGAAAARRPRPERSRISCSSLPGLALYLIVLPRVYGFSTLGRLVDLFLLAVPFVLSVSFLGQFVERLVQAPRDRGPALHRHQPAALLPGRRLLAGRGDPAVLRAGEPRLSEHVGDRRPGPHQPDGRDSSPTCRRTGRGCGCWPPSTLMLAAGAAKLSAREGGADARTA